MPGLSTKAWVQMAVTGTVLCVGGPALVYWVSPTEEEIFKRYNPDLQKRSLATRQERQQEFDDFAMKLRDYSKSDKPIWEAEREAREKEAAEKRQGIIAEKALAAKEAAKRKEEMLASTKS